MAVPLELLDKYLTTFLDFWLLRPRKFLSHAKEERTRYLPPAQFVGVSSTIIIALIAVSLSIARLDIEKIGGSQLPPSEAVAIRTLVFILALLFLNTIFYRMVSRIWPIKGIVTLISIFEFQCYLTAILVPMAAADVLIDPITIGLVAHGGPTWILTIPSIAGLTLGFVFFFVYQNPGVAALNGVSSLRMFLGTLFWFVAVPSVVGLLVGFVIGILKVRSHI